MLYIGLKGGLGNQMFQYAFGVAASIESQIPFTLDITLFDTTSSIDTKRSYNLNHFNIQAQVAQKTAVAKFHTKKATIIRKIQNKLWHQNDYEYNPSLLKVKNNQYIEGYWQSEKYFKKYKNIIQQAFTPKEPFGIEAKKILDFISTVKISGAETILVHIRRGDYVTNAAAAAFHGVQDTNYYLQALDYIDAQSTKSKFVFVATDDVQWAKENFKSHHSFTYISRTEIHDFEEILIMSKCDHFIISNSSFSWWSAWLGQYSNKIVVAPKKWIKNPNISTPDIIPDEWIKI